MIQSLIIPVLYLLSGVFFIVGLKLLSHPKTAPRGNSIAAIGMLIAIIATLLNNQILSYELIFSGIIIGGLIGSFAARRVEMTSMPQLVALFNGFGGGASLLVASAEFYRIQNNIEEFIFFAILLSIFIGGLTLTGSIVAFGKLQGIIKGSAIKFRGQNFINALLFLTIIVSGFLAILGNFEFSTVIIVSICISLLLGYLGVIPIGGADMPVVISLLNSFSGLAAATTGFVLLNNSLIISGSLVGASGIILTNIMCKGMNRTIWNVLFTGLGSNSSSNQSVAKNAENKIAKSYEPEDTVVIFENAKNIIVVPGYGMAVAQAQQIVSELEKVLESKGSNVKYAIHPVAGRMPGHMNVLLAEANVSYDKLFDLDDINPEFEQADIAIVIGANDVVNPAARNDQSSPLYGMPILDVDKAQTVFVLKRSMNPGFAGIENELFFNDNSIMLFGDAKETISRLVSELKQS
tara:strand:+ start:10179 stop:11570 length:1392 start_codon:yes stop_codon:yes gene_type:complete